MIEILRRVLKYFLQRTGAPLNVDDAVRRDRQEAVFPNTVLKVFGDLRRKRTEWFLSVLIGRQGNPRAAPAALLP
jgi:hypothetical protein